MNYSQWAKEYEQQVELLGGIIDTLKSERKNCKIMYKIDELNTRINSLYNMYLECKHTAKMLREREKEGICL